MKMGTPTMERSPLRDGKHDGYDTYEYDVDHYYGRNDPRPNTCGKRLCIYLGLIVFSPVILVLFVFYAVIVVFFLLTADISEYQIKTGKIIGCEFWYRVPGKRLRVVPTPETAPALADGTPERASSDILISEDFCRIDEDGTNILDTCRHLSLRKSIEVTLKEDLRKGPHGNDIRENQDRGKARYLLHGWPEPRNPNDDEIWCTHARTTTWAALYSWSGRLPIGRGILHYNQSIDLATAQNVFGYVYLMEVANPEFYRTDRIVEILNPMSANAPDHTPRTEDKIFVRYNYGQVRYMGDFPKNDPDAYVFKGRKVMEDADLRVLHRYRILKPGVVPPK